MPRTSRQVSFRTRGMGRGRVPGAMIVSGLVVAGALGGWVWLWRGGPAVAPAEMESPPQVSVLPTNERIALSLGEPKGPSVPALERNAAPKTELQSQPPATQPAAPPATNPANPAAHESSSPATSPAGAVPPPITAQSTRDAAVQMRIAAADSSIAAGRQAEARTLLNRAMHDPRASDADVEMLRARIADLNQTLVFSPTVAPGDPLVETYAIQPGDRLIKVANASDLKVDWRFIQRVNKMSDPGRLRVGQKIKLVKGPFHAIVYKSDHRLDLYADATDPDGNRLFIRSLPVGLGESNSTPIGKWIVRPSSKLVNPHWVNPRTGERFAADDPKNPIGEFWLGLTGVDSQTEVLSGYGIHGTIEPESIGRDASMGCVRMLADDIALIYEMLVEQYATVEIRP
ncbi:MAG: L,D-transpeptidase family protein [Phycisphaerae bacterium]|nr:L,D-transpeptidase family protein [Phycisphaerae bacterium]